VPPQLKEKENMTKYALLLEISAVVYYTGYGS
jgi:hypothetical protein